MISRELFEKMKIIVVTNSIREGITSFENDNIVRIPLNEDSCEYIKSLTISKDELYLVIVEKILRDKDDEEQPIRNPVYLDLEKINAHEKMIGTYQFIGPLVGIVQYLNWMKYLLQYNEPVEIIITGNMDWFIHFQYFRMFFGSENTTQSEKDSYAENIVKGKFDNVTFHFVHQADFYKYIETDKSFRNIIAIMIKNGHPFSIEERKKISNNIKTQAPHIKRAYATHFHDVEYIDFYIFLKKISKENKIIQKISL